MNFEGSWKRVKSVNEAKMLEYIGVPSDNRQLMINAEASMKIKRDGDTMQEVFSMLGQDRINTMQIGTYLQYIPGKYLTFDGKYVNCKYEFHETYVEVSYSHNGVKYRGKRSLQENNKFLVDDLILDDGKCVSQYVYEKIEEK